MKRYLMIFSLLVLATLGYRVAPGLAGPEVTVNLAPAEVQMGTFYNGTTVTVSGEVPAAAEVVIRLSGAIGDLHMKKKGKVGGLLWMNTGDLTYHNAPGVYKVYTSTALDDLDYTPAAVFGLTALRDRIEVSPAGEDKDFLVKELVRLKEKDVLYSREKDCIRFGAAEGGMKSYQAHLSIPPAMTQGAYTVEVAAVENGRVLPVVSGDLSLKQVSFPAQLSSMAFGNATWYGIMSVVVALVAGLLMGSLFRGKGGAH